MGMLVLERGPEEEIVIGPDVRVRVVAIGRHRVRLGVTAPGRVVHRREVAERIARESDVVGCDAKDAPARGRPDAHASAARTDAGHFLQ